MNILPLTQFVPRQLLDNWIVHPEPWSKCFLCDLIEVELVICLIYCLVASYISYNSFLSQR